jgi:hypothetical protein
MPPDGCRLGRRNALSAALTPRKAEDWRVLPRDDPDLNELPELVWYCPICAELEFGPLRDRL